MGGGFIPPPISSPPRASGAVSSVCLPQRSASTGMVRNYHIEPLAIERSGTSLMVTSQLRDGTKCASAYRRHSDSGVNGPIRRALGSRYAAPIKTPDRLPSWRMIAGAFQGLSLP